MDAEEIVKRPGGVMVFCDAQGRLQGTKH